MSCTCHVVIVAQEREFQQEDRGDLDFTPTVSSDVIPSVAKWLNPACDYIVETFKRPEYKLEETVVGDDVIKTKVAILDTCKYCLRVGPNPTYVTKFRRPVGSKPLPNEVEDPTFDKVLALIKGE